MKHRSISKCCKARVEFLQGKDVAKCRDIHTCEGYLEEQKMVVFRCTKCGRSCNIIAGLVA